METRSKARQRRSLLTSGDIVNAEQTKGDSAVRNLADEQIRKATTRSTPPRSPKRSRSINRSGRDKGVDVSVVGNIASSTKSSSSSTSRSPQRRQKVSTSDEAPSSSVMTGTRSRKKSKSPGRRNATQNKQPPQKSPPNTVEREERETEMSKSDQTSSHTNNILTATKPMNYRRDGREQSFSPIAYVQRLKLAQRYVTALDIPKRVFLYVLVVIAGSIVHEVTEPPETYFAEKKNFFNQFFVKLSWGWTLGIVFLFILPASYTIRKANLQQVIWDCSRLVVGGTVIWYVVIGTFFWVEDITGQCIGPGGQNFTVKRPCVKAGLEWDGYDISGHTFLLIHCALIIYEELQTYVRLAKQGKRRKTLLQYFLDFMFVVVVLLVVLWEFMLLCTQIYFHVWHHKIIAVVVALSTWYLSYRVVYPKLNSWFDKNKTSGIAKRK